MTAANNEAMESAILTLHKLSADEKIRLECEAREMYEHDIARTVSDPEYRACLYRE